jgi:hypothetical protein
VTLCDPSAGETVSTLRGHTGPVCGVAFSPDGHWLATGGTDQLVIVWEARSGEEVFRLRGHSYAVKGLAFSPDRRRLATAGDMTVKLWDLATGQETQTLHQLGFTGMGLLVSVAFSADGQRLAAASPSIAAVWLWEATPQTPDVVERREALALVCWLFDRRLLRDDVLEQIRSDGTISEGVRRQARALAEPYREDPDKLDKAGWAVVRRKGAGPEEYRRALRCAEAACRLNPENGAYLETLALAQYRLGRYGEALAAVTEADRRNAARPKGRRPEDIAILAMTLHQLDRRGEAQAALEDLRAAMKKPEWAKNSDCQELLREAEALLQETPPATNR